MRLTEQLRQVGRWLCIAGGILLALGVLFLGSDISQSGFKLADLAGIIGISIVIPVAIYFYQIKFHWRKLRERLLKAETARDFQQLPALKPLPIWAWLIWAVIAFVCAYFFRGAFTIFFGAFLMGFGLANPQLSKNVEELEAGRALFYAQRDLRGRPIVVRVLPEMLLARD
ncbi:hypothetical protein [Herpetosiphon geysericola]|uniref:Uncharacterized protein n=1 Tax=Herpetosiphon geysericola TaxID=70996 RepID=A0A0P6Z368_9CHLR|nr:hypothetical protein [Herpetosiphon geysericola]KPL91669.1 hypothetical protein SE18_01375 [Herpetosiphon geysericola]